MLGDLEIGLAVGDLDAVFLAPGAALFGREVIPLRLDAAEEVFVAGAAPGAGEIDRAGDSALGILVLDAQAAADFFGEMADHFLDEVGHFLEVRVGPVGLEHGELGIVAAGDAFVAEVAVEFENFREAADEEALEIKLRRDAQIEVHTERVVVRLERLGGRSAGDRLHHRRLDFDESAVLEEPADFADDRDAFLENLERLAVRDEIEVALAVFDLGVLDAVPFVGKGAEGL